MLHTVVNTTRIMKSFRCRMELYGAVVVHIPVCFKDSSRQARLPWVYCGVGCWMRSNTGCRIMFIDREEEVDAEGPMARLEDPCSTVALASALPPSPLSGSRAD
jgi:hypothetical protein